MNAYYFIIKDLPMKILKSIKLLSVILLLMSSLSYALPNISGEYNCKGDDSHDGKYTGTVVLTLDSKNTIKQGSGYTFSLVEGSGSDINTYSGFAAFDGKHIAIYFANKDESKKDYGVGVATVTGNKFTKFYYEPQYATSGSTGIEACTKK
jgi:hypothetical protein